LLSFVAYRNPISVKIDGTDIGYKNEKAIEANSLFHTSFGIVENSSPVIPSYLHFIAIRATKVMIDNISDTNRYIFMSVYLVAYSYCPQGGLTYLKSN